ncbi:hypothetical protein Tco_0372987, partial [Tanacetum coccineum]
YESLTLWDHFGRDLEEVINFNNNIICIPSPSNYGCGRLPFLAPSVSGRRMLSPSYVMEIRSMASSQEAVF